MLTPDPVTVLTAVADHLATNPALARTAVNVQPLRAEIQIYPTDWERPAPNLGVLADWILTMHDVGPAVVKVAPTGAKGGHLVVRALLHDGTVATVVVVLDVGEGRLLAANVTTEIRVGDEVPVALLLRLVKLAHPVDAAPTAEPAEAEIEPAGETTP